LSIAKDFVDALKEKKGTSPYDTTAIIKRIEGGTAWVHIPGGVDETPVKLTINASVGETVQVRVANGTAFLVGNASAPPTDDYTANVAMTTADEAKEEVTILNTVVAENIAATNARFGEVEADTAKIHNLTAEELTASVGYISDLTADSITAEDIASATGYIGELTAESITAQDISSATGYIGDLTTNNVTAQNIIADHGTIGNLNSNYAHITNGVIDNAKIGHADVNGLNVNYAHLTNGTIDNAKIDQAKVNNLAANYAKIDATNINTAAIRNAWVDAMMVQSGLIAHEGTVYTLDAIKVNATNITAGTIDVERLIVTVDGEKYMVHIDPSTGTPSYEKLDGDVIEDLTITADKIVAGAVTAEKITTENIVGSGGWINLRNGTFQYVNAQSGDGIAWDGTNLTINSASFVSNVSNKFSSQNLLPGIYRREYMSGTTYEDNGITWTVNADGSITATGTATANSTYHCTAWVLDSNPPVITIDPNKRYTVSGCPAGGSTTTYRMFARFTAEGTTPGSNTGNLHYEYGEGYTETTARKYCAVGCQILSGYNCGTGVTFYPMLEVGTAKHNYVSSHSTEGALSSSIRQNASDISFRVQKNDVINQINLSTEGATISATRVNIEGATIFTNGRLSENSLDNAYDSKGSASSAESNAKSYTDSSVSGKADKSVAVKSTVSCYYRSTTNSTPTINDQTTIGTAKDTDDAWEYVMPYPKRDRYFYTCERYVHADNTVTFSTVRALSNATYTSKWCSASNASYIDGGSIYANSVTASQIDTSTITVGALSDGADYSTTTQMNTAIEAGKTIENLLPMMYQRESVSGTTYESGDITWTVNPDGSVTATGTATANSQYAFSGNSLTQSVPVITLDPDKKYTFSGTPSGGSASTYYLRGRFTADGTTPSSSSGTLSPVEVGEGVTMPAGYKYAQIYATILSGVNCGSGITFYPMFEIGDTVHNFVSPRKGADALIEDITESAKTATSYITRISANDGVKIHDSARKELDYTQINSDGMHVYKNGTKIAEFGADITLGDASDTHTVIKSTGYDIINGTSNKIAHFGYDSGNNDQGGQSTAPYYSLGIRSGSSASDIGNYSVAEGASTTASGYASHSEGFGPQAIGEASHAEGMNTSAISDFSHAEGQQCVAGNPMSGGSSAGLDCGHAEGYRTIAYGNSSHSQNYFTYAVGMAQTAIGKYNVPQGTGDSISNSDHAFIIGNGTDDTTSDRSNALAVDWNGNTRIAGDVYVGCSADSSGGTKLGEIDVNDSITLSDVYASGFITNGQKRLQFFIPYAWAGTGTYIINELDIISRFINGVYGYLRSGTDGANYTAMGSSFLNIIHGGSGVRRDELTTFSVESVPYSGFKVTINTGYAIARANTATTAVTNNSPVAFQINITITRTA